MEVLPECLQASCRRTKRAASIPVHEFLQVVVALAVVVTLDKDAAANAVDDRVGAQQARAVRIMALRDAGVRGLLASNGAGRALAAR